MADPDFTKIDSVEPVVKYLTKVIKNKLAAGQKVLWLVSGGSAIEIATEASHQLLGADLKNLAVTLTDERYGPVGHKDSNWQQLKHSGFSLPEANLQPVLTGKDFEATTADFNNFLNHQLDHNEYKIGLFGMGTDGHTAGILPASPAVSTTRFAVGYDGPDYKRITTAPKAIAKLDEAVIFAVGESKHTALDNLVKNLPIGTQPAQILKQVPKLIVYNDYKGEGK